MLRKKQNYIRLFKMHSGYESFTGSTEFIKPNVSRCIKERENHYSPYRKPIEDAVVTYDYTTYNGQTQIATNIVAIMGSKTLVEGVDYEVSGNDGGINAGDYTFTVNGIGKYEGSKECTFTINIKEVTPTIELSEYEYEYDGTAKEPTVTVKDGDDIIDASEYTITYSDNVSAGTANVSVTDNEGGNYSITSVDESFTINKANRTLSFTKAPAKIITGTTATTIAAPSMGANEGTITYSSSDTTIATINGNVIRGVAIGSSVITATITEGDNCLSATTSYTLDVTDIPYVDLGLPSKTLWAAINLGAATESEYGNYYQYGKGASQYAATSAQTIYQGTESELSTNLDAAYKTWGSGWRMPTQAQLDELLSNSNTSKVWSTIDGVRGLRISKKNHYSPYIFIPAAGSYSNGTLHYRGDSASIVTRSNYSGSTDQCVIMSSDRTSLITTRTHANRSGGYSIRPVKA